MLATYWIVREVVREAEVWRMRMSVAVLDTIFFCCSVKRGRGLVRLV